jgi:hypothetical protein
VEETTLPRLELLEAISELMGWVHIRTSQDGAAARRALLTPPLLFHRQATRSKV